jgi:hypothetical protein
LDHDGVGDGQAIETCVAKLWNCGSAEPPRLNFSVPLSDDCPSSALNEMLASLATPLAQIVRSSSVLGKISMLS